MKATDLSPAEASTAGLKAAICGEVARRCANAYGSTLRAVVLTGSLARGEATPFRQSERSGLLGDAEFLVVFGDGERLPETGALNRLGQEAEAALWRQDVACQISLSAVRLAYLCRLPPHIFTYELRTCGEVVWGDQLLLGLIPAFAPSDISREDAWRLLGNRMIELLEAVADPAGEPRRHYRTVKLYLDMATSYLVFAGAYEPTYRGRAERLSALVRATPPNGGGSLPLEDFADRVLACTHLKLQGRAPEETASGLARWEDAIGFAERLWRWELAQLTGLSEESDHLALWAAWARRQPLAERLRGWLFVLRHRGWHRSWRDWPRWGRLALRASPRYLVYAVASQALFRLPAPAPSDPEQRTPALDCQGLRGWLPALPAPSRASQANWRGLVADVVWNYHEFLVGTRA